jgi:molecular chaperone GrpE
MAFETEKDLAPEEEPVTSRDEAGEPSGEEDPANEEERIVEEPEDYLALAQRIQADFENYRKRAAREASEAERRGRASVARELVAPIDNLERALRAAGIDPDEQRTSDGEAPSEEVSAQEALARGLALVYGELQAALARTGIESYNPAGERFDPSSSEAISTRPADGAEAGVVVETLERGYRIGDHVLRPARVVVAE